MPKKVKTTKLDIIRCASKFFFEEGYSVTSPRLICNELDIYTGNITYYFPTKEHLLAVFVHMLCDFQWRLMEEETREGYSSIMAICLELATMAAMCEEDEIAKDFYISAYSSPMCLEIIRENDRERAKKVFKDYCPKWTSEYFEEAEILVSGIEYSTLMTGGVTVPLELRIGGALNNILSTYNIPNEIRKNNIDKVLSMDYRKLGRRVLREFREYIDEVNEQAFAELYNKEK